MNVWLINLFDSMSRDAARVGRVVALAQAFCDAGHTVIWWTSDWDHAHKRKRDPKSFEGHAWNVEVIPTLPYHRNTSLRRVRSHARFARDWLKQSRAGIQNKTLNTPDLVLVNLPPPSVGAAVAELKAEFGFFMVVDIRDAWPENFSQLLPFNQKWNERIGAWLFAPLKRSARKAYRAADAITAVSQDYLDVVETYKPIKMLASQGGNSAQRIEPCGSGIAQHRALSIEHPTSVFYIGCPEDRLEVKPAAHAERPSDAFRMVYVGSMSTSYDLLTLVDALDDPQLSGRSVELHFAGDGDAVPALRRRAEQVGQSSSTIHFHGLLGLVDLRGLLERCHLGLNAVKPGSRIAMPNKIGDYFAAGLPVLHSVASGELAGLIQKHDMGALYPAGDASALAGVITECLDAPEHLAKQSINVRKFAEDHLDRRVIYPRMVATAERWRAEEE